ncbi:MAG: GTPase ObgE [Verrucomicrobiota bacterium]
MFVDRVRIWAKAGDGGDGCCHFRRELYVPRGGPDGGDGGKGGDIIMTVNPQMNNLSHLKFHPHHFAEHGKKGMGAQKTGGGGKNKILEVPPGTCVYRLSAAEEDFERAADMQEAELMIDLVEPEQKFILCAGGKGGAGNVHFKSSINRAPRRYTEGKHGEKGQFLLELKSIADIGLVGFPNAGKSSLLSTLSAARPKIAPYPFTTLQPMIGVLEFEHHQRATMADIPGLIEGAHQGVGLGHDFLRHIERCGMLLFVLDMAGSEGRHPSEDYAQLRKEIKLHQAELAKRPFFIVANKMDLPDAERLLKEFRRKTKVKIIPVSAQTGEGLEKLKKEIQKNLKRF